MSSVTRIMSRWFFFSSRRRHTRSKRDWSSDVCSSDLAVERWGATPAAALRTHSHHDHVVHEDELRSFGIDVVAEPGEWTRSEERRVGKSVDLGGGRCGNKNTGGWYAGWCR